MAKGRCSIDGCERFIKAHGWCSMHYTRWYKHGDPLIVKPAGYTSRALPFLLATYRTSAAHHPGWPFGSGTFGYGYVHVDAKHRLVHRYVWSLEHGPIPEGLCICHACDTPACFWIEHLWLGTQADNLADMRAKGRGRFMGAPAEKPT